MQAFSLSIYLLLCIFFEATFLHSSNFAYGCYIWGTDSGYCSVETLDAQTRNDIMPYCGKRVLYPACLPKQPETSPSREFPGGRWTNFNTRLKDEWVMNNTEAWLDYRIALEVNGTLHRKVANEYGDPGRIIRRFHKRPDCQEAFRNLFCYINFPRCDPDRDITLPTCRSVCENFFKACVYAKDLWRCGQSKFFNGYFPEKPTTLPDGNITYLRDYFPGQPWRKNKFNAKGSDLPVCTPALKGFASEQREFSLFRWIAMISLLFLSLLVTF